MVKKVLGFITFFIAVILFAAPLVLTLYYSFISGRMTLNMNNYKDLFINCFSFYPAFWNTVMYSIIIAAMQIVVILLASFAFTQIKSKCMDILFIFFVILMLMPLQVTLLPNYIGLRDMNMLDTRSAIIIPLIFSPLCLVIMRQYMKNLNFSIIEAVRLESNSIIRIIISGVIPQIKNCIFAVIILSIAESWNMLEQPMQFLKSADLMPLSVFMSSASEYGNSILYPAAVISIIPIMLIYFIFQETLTKGIVIGGEQK